MHDFVENRSEISAPKWGQGPVSEMSQEAGGRGSQAMVQIWTVRIVQ
jgi:hypothetical protein